MGCVFFRPTLCSSGIEILSRRSDLLFCRRGINWHLLGLGLKSRIGVSLRAGQKKMLSNSRNFPTVAPNAPFGCPPLFLICGSGRSRGPQTEALARTHLPQF